MFFLDHLYFPGFFRFSRIDGHPADYKKLRYRTPNFGILYGKTIVRKLTKKFLEKSIKKTLGVFHWKSSESFVKILGGISCWNTLRLSLEGIPRSCGGIVEENSLKKASRHQLGSRIANKLDFQNKP